MSIYLDTSSGVPVKIYPQSGVIPYRRGHDGLEVLLVSSRGGQRWAFPKGMIAKGLTAEASAAKEALEEAGASGTLSAEPVGVFRFPKWDGLCEVEVFALEVTSLADEYDESVIRERRWVPAGEVPSILRDDPVAAVYDVFLARMTGQ